MNRIRSIQAAVLGCVLWALFANDLETDRDMWTWLWLLSSLLWFYISDILRKQQ